MTPKRRGVKTGPTMMSQIARSLLLIAITCLLAGVPRAHAQDWRLEPPPEDPSADSSFLSLLSNQPMSLSDPSPLGQRPRLTVALSPTARTSTDEAPTLSWSLEAWEVNTASLAHIQCSRAIRTIESFLVEDCKFVDQPLPDNSTNLIQVSGRWMAAPGLSVSAGAYAGRRRAGVPESSPLLDARALSGALPPGGLPATERIEGVNMNVSFGLRMGQIGDLLLDLQLERYRQAPESFALSAGLAPAAFDPTEFAGAERAEFNSAGQLGVAWRGRQFGADLTGQYRELPYWLGEGYSGEGFRSFDIELSWRAPARASISVGVTNVLDERPAGGAADQNMQNAVDGIYGRIPYVRYKHDL